MNRHLWVYDIETIASVFTYTAINVDTGEIVKFVIHKDLDQRVELLDHLRTCKGLIGFNNLAFDYPILHYFMTEAFYKYDTAENLILDLYDKAQWIIEVQNSRVKGVFTTVKESEVLIPQLDLFKVWHYNNAARSTGLKALQISMNYPNVLDMPIEHTKTDVELSDIPMILEYNLNDVLATYEFYKKSLDKINLRKELIKLYGLKMINWNDVKIGESIFLKLLSEDMNINSWELNKLRTYRESIHFKDIILDTIKFENKTLQQLLDKFKTISIKQTKNGFKDTIILQNQFFEYGQGGLHQCCKSGIYVSDDQYDILDIDVKSFYPNIAVQNKFRPEHLGESFSKIYSDIYVQRTIIPKNDPRNGALKLMLNGCFGKAGDENSFLYDNKFLLSITVNGQLLLSMLIDKLLFVPDIFFVQTNTDGVSVRFKKEYKELIFNICKKWENYTKLELEYVEYTKMIIGDVNNYLAVTVDGKIKHKGRFEVDKVVGSEPAYHKDNSFRIIPLALEKYFVQGIPVEETILNHKNIYDFCGRQKFKSDSYGEIHKLENNEKKIIKQQKNVRYYISNNGCTFVKKYTKDNSSELINVGYKVTIFNKFEEKENYDINYNFYINSCKKEINNIQNAQMCLNF